MAAVKVKIEEVREGDVCVVAGLTERILAVENDPCGFSCRLVGSVRLKLSAGSDFIAPRGYEVERVSRG